MRRVAVLEHGDDRGRCEHIDLAFARAAPRPAIAVRCPAQKLVAAHGKGLAVDRDAAERVHRDAVRIDVFQLEPLYAFSSLTAWTGVVILALIFGLIVALSLAIGRFLLQSATDIALTSVLFAVAIACFVVPLLGLHGRIVDEKRRQQAAANAVLSGVVAEAATRSRAGDFDGLARLKDAALTAESAVSSVQRIPTWPWRRETLRGFSSAVILPIVLWLLFQGLTRVLPG